MSVAVDLILPDSGPLISLAHADRLDLIAVFDRPVVIADIVKLECLKKPGSPDHAVLDAWFKRASNRIRVVDTPMRGLYEAALGREATGEEPRATSGFGDATFAYILRNIDRYAAPDAIALVLIEDSRVSTLLARFDRAHILSTRTWLTSLERAGGHCQRARCHRPDWRQRAERIGAAGRSARSRDRTDLRLDAAAIADRQSRAGRRRSRRLSGPPSLRRRPPLV